HSTYISGASIAGAPDGKTVVTGTVDGIARLWEVATGKLLYELRHESEITVATFSRDGKRLATASNTAAQVWDPATGQPLTPLLRHQGHVLAVSFSPDSRLLLTGSGDKTTRLWDVATGKRIGPHFQHPERVRCAVFGTDGGTIVTVDETEHEM